MDPHREVKAEPSASHNVSIKIEPGSESVPRAPNASRSPASASAPGIKPDPEAQSDSINGADEQTHETDYLERLVTHDVPEVLEAGVSVGVRLLDQLKDALKSVQSPDAKSWLASIQEIQERTKPTRTVVGVVGNTGAGKSSVINALLDEERLLPTNCLRACTASPTEISYNYSEDPSELYRAEIEFISNEDWIRELEVLFSDLLDGNGEVSRECTNSDSDAGVAYAKLKAVYPAKTREMLARATPKNLAKEPYVRGVLGSVKTLKDESAQDLYRRLQHYVDSKEKSTGSDHKKRDVPIEYWPLIKVVRIYTKADALSTGAVLVDLPGVQDSNAARAAVAANYMKLCTGLWIVAPITRAVDDKTAKSLLGDSFKRQLKYDGTYSAVSFICSKTDDISITEAADSLGIEEEISESWDRAEDLRKAKKSHQDEIVKLKKEKAALGERLDECEAKYDVWEELQGQISDGKIVYAPSDNSKKRKRPAKSSRSRRNRVSFDSDDDDYDDVASDSGACDKENSQPEEDRRPLNDKKIEETLASIKAQRKQIRGDRRAIDSQIADICKEISNVQSERDAILSELKAMCIKGRNDYSCGAIKQDFAAGIKELDQENAIEEDDTTFDPDQDIRDYDAVARSLPVFCVSSRAYQKLSERLKKDDFRSDGFLSLEDTEIPRLQEHAKKLTEAGRASHCRRLLNDLTQLVNSMKLWAANDGTQTPLTDVEKRREELHLRKLLDELEKGFETSVKWAIALIEQSLNDHIYETFNSLIPFAVDAALDTASGWGAHRYMGGLFWATYRATVRRNGVYSGASGPRDFNQELFEPISCNLANEWERAFQRRLPSILTNFAKETNASLLKFKQAAETRAEQRLTNPAGLLTLSNQILAHMRTLEELPTTLRTGITDLQREASRQFTPVICNAMMHAYEVCTNESGAGSYARMKLAMEEHVEEVRHTMFLDATDTVKMQLQAMCRAVRKDMSETTENIYDAVFRDYMSVLVGTTVDRRAKVPRQKLDLRKRVKEVLLRGDLMFAPILGESEVRGPEDMDGSTSTSQVQDDRKMKAMPAAGSSTGSEPNHDDLLGDEDIPVKAETREEADEVIQRFIREQSTQQEDDEAHSNSDFWEDQFPDIMDILKE
ncbi:hypothetical protein F5X99DRAFT_379222 [Biscogniauxia marginata]|nr:hypothetical protein F5X99DRAFT_379222 [Biscogniauxia marginata]